MRCHTIETSKSTVAARENDRNMYYCMQGGGRLNKQRAAKKEWDEWKEEEDRRLSSVFVGRLEVKMGK